MQTRKVKDQTKNRWWKKNQHNQAKYYDQQSRPLKDLHIGEKVSMLDSKTYKPAVVMERCEEPRSFMVKTENDKNLEEIVNIYVK